MKKNNLILIIVLILCIVIAGLFFFLRKPNDNNKGNNEPIEESNLGVGYDTSEETGWLMELYIYGFNESFKIFSEDYNFEFNGEKRLTFTLDELGKRGMDISRFNTDNIHCDTEKTYMLFEYDESYQTPNKVVREFYLDCTNDNN